MKKIVYIILLFPLLVLGQSKNQNFVKTVTYKKPSTAAITTADTLQNIAYFDGLGRVMQKVAAKGGGNGRDLVVPIEYEYDGRQTKQYLPYANAGTAGLLSSPNYRPSIIPTQETYYKSKYPEDVYGTTAVTYSEIKTDNSPLGRVTEIAAPGTNWAVGSGHTIKTEYGTNTYIPDNVWDFRVQFTGNDTEKPELYIPSSRPILGTGGYYSTGALYKIITKDENWTSADGNNKTTHEFKDKQGRLILKRTFDGGQPHDTYYVYDDFGNLTFVLPPITNDDLVTAYRPITPPLAWTEYTIDQTLVQKYGYKYSYDSRNRVVEKKIPGKDAEYIVYDKLDRPVLTQTALQRNPTTGAGLKWLFVKYDKFDRVVYSGEYTSTATRTALQNSINGASNLSESKTTTLLTLNGTSINYTNIVFPTTGIELFSANYYDNNDFNKPASVNVPTTATDYGNIPTTNLKTLPTGSKVRVLEAGSTTWITTAMGYDAKGRVIWSKNDNPYYTTSNTLQIKLDFTGNVLETKTEHVRTGTGYQPITILDYYTYDFVGRPLLHTQKVNSAATGQVISSKTYNEVGQLITKNVGGTQGIGSAQIIDYKYNVRGWLTKINDPNSLGSDIFAESLSYNLPTAGGTALHNGNISQATWKTSNDNNLRTYNYTYDALNRIKSGIFVSTASLESGSYNLNSVTYDKNGNITYLHRDGVKLAITPQINMDKMTYFYEGNQLTRVKEDGLVNVGFKGVAPTNTATQYTYDKNGNTITDINKGITKIEYNQLNLPTKVIFSGGKYIDYSYDAVGNKLKKTFYNGTTSTITEYNGGFVYLKSGVTSSTLEYIPTEEGYIFKNASGVFSYAYQLKDHLGNVRITFTDLNNNHVITTNEIIEESNYDPFGMKHMGYNTTTLSIGSGLAQKLEYNGKEYEEASDYNMNEMDWRHYDPAIGRFNSIDKLSEIAYGISPYAFANNNPIRFVDPSGLSAVYNWGTGKYTDNGIVVSFDDAMTSNGVNFFSVNSATAGYVYEMMADSYQATRRDGGAGDRGGSGWFGRAWSWLTGKGGRTVTVTVGPLEGGYLQEETYTEKSSMDGYFNPAYDITIPNRFSPYIPSGFGFTAYTSVNLGYVNFSGGFSLVWSGNRLALYEVNGTSAGLASSWGINSSVTFDIHDNFGSNTNLFEGLNGSSITSSGGYIYNLGYSSGAAMNNGSFQYTNSGTQTFSIGAGSGVNYGQTNSTLIWSNWGN